MLPKMILIKQVDGTGNGNAAAGYSSNTQREHHARLEISNIGDHQRRQAHRLHKLKPAFWRSQRVGDPRHYRFGLKGLAAGYQNRRLVKGLERSLYRLLQVVGRVLR
jgi:hypothetical protein